MISAYVDVICVHLSVSETHKHELQQKNSKAVYFFNKCLFRHD